MKVINKTVWRTDQLRAILQRAAEQELEPAKRKTLVVTVEYTRGGYSSGCAYLGGRHATVRIRHPKSRRARWIQVQHDDPRRSHGGWNDGKGNSGKIVRDDTPKVLTETEQKEMLLALASVAVHEFAHIRGMDHAGMPNYYKWHGKTWRDYVQWATDFPLEEQAKPVKARPTANDKLAHVLKMQGLAETRLRRAQTILKKWKAKARYYQKAAQRAAPEGSNGSV